MPTLLNIRLCVLFHIKGVELEFFAVEGGVCVLANPVAKDSQRAPRVHAIVGKSLLMPEYAVAAQYHVAK